MSSRPGELDVRGPRNHDEIHFANDLMAKVYYSNYYDGLQKIRMFANGYPGNRPEYTRLAFWGAELAGTLRVTADTIRIGEARLHMGGLGWVSTAEHHRHKGVARELILDTMQFLRGRGFHVAMLFGIPNFYHRFGFTTTLAEYQIDLSTADAITTPASGVRVRHVKPGDVPAIQRFHSAGDAATACSLIRIAPHVSNRWDQWKECRVLTDDRGKVLAYFVPRRTADCLVVDEIGFSDRALCGPLLHACAAMAAEEVTQLLRFHAPPEHPFIQYLLQFRSRHEMQILRDEGGMMAFVNVGETLESMIPEWEAQVLNSAARSLRVETTLVVDRVHYRVRANRGAIDIAATAGTNKLSVTQPELMQLMTGYRFLDDILAQRRRILAPEARLLLAALFPKRSPYVWQLDRF